MKKIVIVGLSMLIMSSVLYAQDAQKMNTVKTDLFSAILRTGVLKYERAINEDMSVQLGFFYTGYSPGDSEVKLSGFGIQVVRLRNCMLFNRFIEVLWVNPK